ncbi:MAG: ribosome biogenesis GTPase Der [Clostridiaceae bacterium]|nr:ribosome biogenesis GTPase Der [Clostridiaceae bacterium]
MSNVPVVAIVGRPNVGKSSLFNALYGERISIVHDMPGVTRDRLYARATWREREFLMIDTGGIELDTDDEMMAGIIDQAQIAIDTADVILYMCDVKAGLTASDRDIAIMLRKSGRPVVVCVNKVDNVGDPPPEYFEFYQLGLGDVFPVSASHRLGIGELLDAIYDFFPGDSVTEEDEDTVRVALIGKPNAGKSSLSNAMVGRQRSIVSNVPGTTRDALDTNISNKYGEFTIIDTAGLRKKSRIDSAVEKYSMIRSLAAIERASVCVILIDASEGVTEQDTKVAGYAHNAGKACVFAVNKWDLVEKETGTLENMRKILLDRFSFMDYAPVVFLSAKTGQRVEKLFEVIRDVHEQAGKRLKTGLLNELIAEATAMVPTPQDKGKHLKIYYATQVATHPPQFLLFVNNTELMHFSYERYLENQLRKNFGFQGTPIRIYLRNKEKDAQEGIHHNAKN